MHRFFLLCFVVASSACAAGQADDTTSSGTGGNTGSGGSTNTTSTTTDGSGGGFNTTSTGGGTPFGPAEVFGHSATTLYKLNPDTKAVTTVGDFVGCDTSVIDIALDKDSNLYGTANPSGMSTPGALYKIDRMTAQCTKIKDGSYPNSLSFVPAGTLDATKEVLVGFVDDQYVRIDTTTGAVTNVGSQWNNGFISSGDVVSVINGPTYLTIKDETGSTDVCRDCLVEVDPKTGAILKDYGSIPSSNGGYKQVFGTAFWNGAVYGFTNVGELFEITITGNTISTTPIPTMSGLSFYGAGSTTNAPVPQ